MPAATATPVEPAEPAAEKKALPIELAEGGLIAQVFDLLAKRVDAVVDQLRSTTRMLFQIRTVGDWWEYNLGVPERRAVVLDALAETALTLAGALLAYWLLAFALRRPRKLVEDRAAARQAVRQPAAAQPKGKRPPGPASPSEQTVESKQKVPAADRHWSLLRRLPFAVAHWVLELLPLAAFVAVSHRIAQCVRGPVHSVLQCDNLDSRRVRHYANSVERGSSHGLTARAAPSAHAHQRWRSGFPQSLAAANCRGRGIWHRHCRYRPANRRHSPIRILRFPGWSAWLFM